MSKESEVNGTNRNKKVQLKGCNGCFWQSLAPGTQSENSPSRLAYSNREIFVTSLKMDVFVYALIITLGNLKWWGLCTTGNYSLSHSPQNMRERYATSSTLRIYYTDDVSRKLWPHYVKANIGLDIIRHKRLKTWTTTKENRISGLTEQHSKLHSPLVRVKPEALLVENQLQPYSDLHQSLACCLTGMA